MQSGRRSAPRNHYLISPRSRAKENGVAYPKVAMVLGPIRSQENAMITQEFDDFDHIASFFAHWEGLFEQLSRGRFAGTLRTAQGRTVRVVSLNVNQVLLARGVGDPGFVTLIPVTGRNASALWQGRELREGQLVVQGPDAETNHRTARSYEILSLSIPANAFFDAARVLLGSDQECCSRGWEAHSLSPQSAGRLTRSISRFLECPHQPGSCEATQFEQECLRAAVLAVSQGSQRSRAQLSLPARTNLVRRAEELFRTNLAEPVGSVDVCSELDVSDRTLRFAFKERFGMGPMAFYKQVRLNAARQVLKSGQADSVREVARRFGFHHFSNFAADYRRAFGELPSDTRAG